MDQKELQAEMLRVVKSKEVKILIEKEIKRYDPKAFTSEGVIQDYKIDLADVRHNPMGGIMIVVYFNGDKQLYYRPTLTKDSDEKIKIGSGVWSGAIAKLVHGEEKL